MGGLAKALVVMGVALAFLGAQAAQPKLGGELVVAIGTDPDWVDPNKTTHTTAQMLLIHVAENLMRLTEGGEFVPCLAKSWEFSEDGLALTLYLREGVVFHDGTPFNAEVVKLNLERFRWSVYKHFVYPILQKVEILAEYVVKFHFDVPFAAILPHLAHPNMVMLSSKQVTAHMEPEKHIFEPVGTGPFAFERWVRGEYLRFVRNPNYWGEGPYLDAVVWKVVPEDAARVILLETKEVDVIMSVPPHDAPRLAEIPYIEVSNIPSIRNMFIGINVRQRPFDDLRVRQALNYAVDKEAIVRDVLLGAGRVSRSIVGPGVFAYAPLEPYPYDPEKARQLLAEAGYPHGFKAVLHHPTGRYLMDAAIAEAVQAYWYEVGVEVELMTMEWATYTTFLRRPLEKAEHVLYMLGWAPGTVDSHHGTFPLLHTRGATNYGFYSNPKVDALLDQALREVDLKKRAALYAQAHALLWEDCPWVFLHVQNFLNAQLVDVRGVAYLSREHIHVHRAWLDR